MFSSDCEKHMCDKNIRSNKEWRDEMLRLRKTLPNYETHPEFVKTAQCKEVLCTSPPPLPKKDELTEEIQQLEADLKFVNETLTTLKTNVSHTKELLKHHKQKLDTYKIFVKNANADVTSAEASIKQKEQYINHYNVQLVDIRNQIYIKQQEQKRREKEQPPQPASTSKKAASTSKKATKKAASTTKKATKKAASTSKNTSSPTEFEYDQSKRCPNGYKRNKTTKKCQKK